MKYLNETSYEFKRDIAHLPCFKRFNDINCISHYHKSIEIVYVLSGNVDVSINNFLFTLEEHEMAYVPSLASHIFYGNNSKSLTVIFPPNYIELLSDFYIHTFHLKNKPINQKILEDFLELEKEMNCSQLLSFSYFYKIFGLFEKHYPVAQQKSNNNASKLIIDIINYLTKNIKNPLSLEETAATFGYSKYYFSKIFNEYFSCGFSEYVNRIRINNIIKEMATAGTTNTNLIFDNGYNSLSSFYKQFNKFYKTSPAKYLEKLGQLPTKDHLEFKTAIKDTKPIKSK